MKSSIWLKDSRELYDFDDNYHIERNHQPLKNEKIEVRINEDEILYGDDQEGKFLCNIQKDCNGYYINQSMNHEE